MAKNAQKQTRGNNKIDESHNTGKVVDFLGGNILWLSSVSIG